MEKGQTTVNYDKQDFDNLGVNPYEVVIAVSKMSRDINNKVQKYLGHNCEVYPVRVAMNRLQSGQVQFKYKDETEKA